MSPLWNGTSEYGIACSVSSLTHTHKFAGNGSLGPSTPLKDGSTPYSLHSSPANVSISLGVMPIFVAARSLLRISADILPALLYSSTSFLFVY